MAEKNPIVTIVMNDGDVMKLNLSGSCREHSKQFYFFGKQRIL